MAHPEVDAVAKRYGDTVAVDGISFEAAPGRILGLLGPNGAGKTSAIRMIAVLTDVPSWQMLLASGLLAAPLRNTHYARRPRVKKS